MDTRFQLALVFFIEIGESVWDTESHLFSKASRPFVSIYGPITCGNRVYYPFATEQFTSWKEFDECNFFSVNSSWLAIVKDTLRPTDAIHRAKITPFQDIDLNRVHLETDGPLGIVMDGFRHGGDRNELSFEYDRETWFRCSHYEWGLDRLTHFCEHMSTIDDDEILLLWSSTKKLESS